MQHTFRELGVSTPIVDALSARSIHQPFPIQALVLADALAGIDVLAKSPTGSGKTLAFAVPIVERTVATAPRPTALVLVPAPAPRAVPPPPPAPPPPTPPAAVCLPPPRKKASPGPRSTAACRSMLRPS